ncbi:MAG: ABC transporter permease [Rhodospirillales bacterium]|nr:ABC transporter permease [Rhodospirillales bacterium]
MELTADLSFRTRQRHAVADVAEAMRLWRLATLLGWLDIRLRYRGSLLGPFWLTLSTAVMVASLGVLYSTLFHINLPEYMPFLTLSQVLWAYLAGLVTDACTCFNQAEAVIRSMRMPFTVHAVRTVFRNLLILAHNILVIVVVFVWFGIWPGWHGLLALPGMALWCLDSLALCLLLGGFCARFRDIPPIVGSIMQIAFFLTPIIWKPSQLGRWEWVLPLNPFYGLIDVVRAPLLGGMPLPMVWLSAILYSAALLGVTWLFFMRARGRIAFWI